MKQICAKSIVLKKTPMLPLNGLRMYLPTYSLIHKLPYYFVFAFDIKYFSSFLNLSQATKFNW